MNIVVAVTAASGSIYARLLVESLAASEEVERIALVYSENARAVAEHEGVAMPADAKIVEYSNSDLFASPASGSAAWDAMVVVPSSVGTVGRVAGGVSQTLIERAADVMLKERRRLVFVVRETPYSLVHLRNMVALTEAGAVIVPASPSFYSKPATVEELCRTVVERVVALLGIAAPHYEWGKER
ncbi:MAG: UbiX family flavin prenyltransferase [Alistipes sp.]|nr:UbiX family flavin prenyltransferase [Alistipes sp.]